MKKRRPSVVYWTPWERLSGLVPLGSLSSCAATQIEGCSSPFRSRPPPPRWRNRLWPVCVCLHEYNVELYAMGCLVGDLLVLWRRLHRCKPVVRIGPKCSPPRREPRSCTEGRTEVLSGLLRERWLGTLRLVQSSWGTAWNRNTIKIELDTRMFFVTEYSVWPTNHELSVNSLMQELKTLLSDSE